MTRPLLVVATTTFVAVFALAACPGQPAHGEGEGDEGEGAPSEGEGEGTANEGEGEGATSAEGEGEGTTSGEGEGEGEGSATPLDVVVNEVDCQGTQHIELRAAPGLDISGTVITANATGLSGTAGTSTFTLPSGSIVGPTGFFVVEQAHGSTPGFPFSLACFDGSIDVVSAGTTVNSAAMAPFPGSYAGTTWCRLPDDTGPFSLCTDTTGAPNLGYVDPLAVLFDYQHPVTIELDIDASSIIALRDDPRTDVPATFTLTQDDGTSFPPLLVGVALKGSIAGSFRTIDQRAAFRINFGKFVQGQRFLGLKQLKLNNLTEDRSLVHENLGYRMLEAYGIPAAHAGYARHVLVVTDGVTTDYGLHATIEALDSDWMSKTIPQPNHLYEGEGTDTDITPGHETVFNVQSGDAADLTDVIALEQVSQAADVDFFTQFSQHVDVEHATKAWMAAQYIAHWDGYCGGQNNFYFFDGIDGKFSFVTSGIDESLDPAFAGLDPSYDLKTGQSPFAQQGVLFQRCVADPQCSALLDDAVQQLKPAIVGFDAVAMFDDLVAIAEPMAEESAALPGQGKFEYPLDDSDPNDGVLFPGVHQVQQQTRDFLVGRPSVLP